MNREKAKELLLIIQAYVEGKEIEEYSTYYEHWNTVTEEDIENIPFRLRNGIKFRVKLEENPTIEQDAGENKIEGGVLSVSSSVTKDYSEPICRECTRFSFCGIAKHKESHSACTKFIQNKFKEKHYRPYKDCYELINAWKSKTDFGSTDYAMPQIWLKEKDSTISMITDFRCHKLDGEILGSWVTLDGENYNMQELFEEYTFLDDSPCGVKEE